MEARSNRIIAEFNKLIAEFMELSIKEGVCYYTDKDDMFPMGIEVEEPFLPYDTSWDWLMPVVDKCYQEHMSKHIADAVMTCDIDTTYKAVVEFINWYNEQN
jgi:hypothetical protein